MKRISNGSPSPAVLRRTEDIASLIRARREAMALSQQALADRLSVSRKWINELERGNASARLGLVLRALNELGIDLHAEASNGGDVPAKRDPVDTIDIDALADMGLADRRVR